MKAMVADAMDNGAIGLGASYSLNHSGYGGVPMPSTIAPISELDALVGAMGPRGRGVIAIASGVKTPQELEPMAAKYGRPFFQGTGMAMYNEQEPARALRIFDDCAAAIRRGNGLYVQIPCQPLSFDFTMANAYPFYSHSAFDPIKAYTPEQLKAVFRDPSWRAKFRENAKNPRPGMIFQGNWDRVMVAVAHKPSNAKYVNRYAAEIAKTEHRDPLDVMLDLSLDEDLETAFLGRFLNVGDEGVARLLKHEAGVVALSDAGAHLIYMCDAGFGLHFLAHWVRERGDFDLVEGIRRLTSHPADLYGIQNRGRLARRRAGRPAAVRSGHGRNQPGRADRRPAGRRPTHHPPADRRAWRVLQRRQDLRRQGLRQARQGPGPRARPVQLLARSAFSHRSAIAAARRRFRGPLPPV